MPTLLEQLRDELSRSREAAPTQFGAWSIHQKALNADGGLLAGAKDLPGGGVNPYYTGPNSLFGVAGLESDIISTRVQPRGMSGALPAIPSNEMYPFFGYLTGFLADSGLEPDEPCDDPPVAGPAKTCIQTAQYGRYERMTRTVDVTRLGQRINAGDMSFDLRLINDPLLSNGAGAGSPGYSDLFTPNVQGMTTFAAEVLMRMKEVGVAFQNKLARQLWAGNPANNKGGGGYMEFPGLDILIGTNKFDALTGTSCPSLDSIISDFGYNRVDSAGVNAVLAVTYMCRQLSFNSNRMGLDPTQWVIAMRQEAFYELTAVWPCAYLTARCTSVGVPNSANTNLFVDANDQVRMRDELRAGRYLLVDGERWPVVFDDGIAEQTSATDHHLADGCFSSDIYFIPVTVAGGVASTYLQYFDWTGQYAAMSQLGQVGVGQGWYYSDGGRFLWHFQPPNNFCIRWVALIQPRVILRTPQLAGKLQNVAYCPIAHTREPFPDDPYFFNGGVSTNRTLPTLYSDWNPPS